MTFARNLGMAFGAILSVAAKAAVENHSQSVANLGEQQEAMKWENRRQQALVDIDEALKRDTGHVWMSGLTRKQEDAIKLRHEVNTHCRNRSDSMMSYTEQRIVHLQTTSW